MIERHRQKENTKHAKENENEPKEYHRTESLWPKFLSKIWRHRSISRNKHLWIDFCVASPSIPLSMFPTKQQLPRRTNVAQNPISLVLETVDAGG